MSLWEPTRHANGEGRRRRQSEQNAVGGPTGVVVAARMGKDSNGTREVCRDDAPGWRPECQRTTREGCGRSRQMADGGVGPVMPGNAGGGKAP